MIVEQLKEAGLHRHEKADVRCDHREAVRHRPRVGARAAAGRLRASFRERQVFRIDHYLGKETVQNVLAFRFANMMFEPIWNRNYIDHIQITARRGHRHRHARRLLRPRPARCATSCRTTCSSCRRSTCMEPPAIVRGRQGARREGQGAARRSAADAEEVGATRCARSTRPASSGGEEVAGYLEEEGVPADSHTETYAALQLEVHNWRWAGVPIFLRTGKRLARKVTEIAVQLKPVPHLAFQSQGSVGVQPNQLILTVQPNEGVSLSLGAKIPGSRMRIRPVNMEFLYGTSFMSQSPEAYERLILDAMRGDATLFTRNDEVDAQWSIIDPILQAWHADGDRPLPTYAAGTAGPAEADALLGGRAQRWTATL